MAETETAVGVLTDIIEGLGGTTDAETVVDALHGLQDALGDGIDTAVGTYLTDHGVELALTVTDGDLDISLTAEEG